MAERDGKRWKVTERDGTDEESEGKLSKVLKNAGSHESDEK